MAKALLSIHLPDELLCEFLQIVRTFEVGHKGVTMGLSVSETDMTPDGVEEMLCSIVPPFPIVEKRGF